MDEITITRQKFRDAIAAEAASIMTNHRSSETPEAVTLLILGGTAFAQAVMQRLFDKEEKKDV